MIKLILYLAPCTGVSAGLERAMLVPKGHVAQNDSENMLQNLDAVWGMWCLVCVLEALALHDHDATSLMTPYDDTLFSHWERTDSAPAKCDTRLPLLHARTRVSTTATLTSVDELLVVQADNAIGDE